MIKQRVTKTDMSITAPQISHVTHDHMIHVIRCVTRDICGTVIDDIDKSRDFSRLLQIFFCNRMLQIF